MQPRGSCWWRWSPQPAGTAGISGSGVRPRKPAVLYDQVQQAVASGDKAKISARRRRHGRQVQPHRVRANDGAWRREGAVRSRRRSRRENAAAMDQSITRRTTSSSRSPGCASLRCCSTRKAYDRASHCSPNRNPTHSRASWPTAAAICSPLRASVTMRARAYKLALDSLPKNDSSARQLIQFKLDALGG